MTHKATIAILAGVLTLTATSATAGEWRLLGIANTSGIAIAADTSAVTGPQTARSIRVAIALRETTTTVGLTYDYLVEARVIDCVARVSATRHRSLYTAAGVLVDQGPLDGTPTPVAANTLEDLILQAACKGQWLAVPPVVGAPDFVRAVRPILAPPAS